MSGITDEEIIRRRLLIDGDGGNDDKRINNMFKMFMRWCNSQNVDDERDMLLKMHAMLAQCEFTMEKSVQVHSVNAQEQANYEILTKDIEGKIEQMTQQILDSKVELQQAKCIRKNRQEYDALAKVIQQHPDRQLTAEKLKILDTELKCYADTKEKLEEKLEMRRKQFLVLVTYIHELQHVLDEDKKEAVLMDTTQI